MMTPILRSVYLLVALLSYRVHCKPPNEEPAALPLNMDIEWVIQGASISFTGFFCEFLGFSSAFRTLMPQLRMWKGRYKHSMLEPMILGDKQSTMDSDTESNGWMKVDRMMDHDLFEKEARNVQWLTEPSQPPLQSIVQTFAESAPRSKFIPSFTLDTSTGSNDDGSGSSTSSDDMLLPEECLSSTIVEQDIMYFGSALARSYAPHAHTSAGDCCVSCHANPLCVSWTYADIHNDQKEGRPYPDAHPAIGESASYPYKCILHSTMPGGMSEGRLQPSLDAHGLVSKYSRAGSSAGVMVRQSRQQEAQVAVDGSTTARGTGMRFPAPRAVVFHGTMCVYQNTTIYKNGKRDINTIRIGRFMVERSEFMDGMTQDEYSVIACTSHMDEIWVPTEWHRDVFKTIFKMNGMPSTGVNIAVIPESVDTQLFSPTAVRTREGGNPFSVKSRQPEDLCWLEGDDDHDGHDGNRGNNDGNRGRVVCPQREQGGNDATSTSERRFEFLSVFKWERRKGYDILLDAYWSAFSPDDGVVLRLRTYMPDFVIGADPNITVHLAEYAERKFNATLPELAPVIWETGVDGSRLSDSLTREDVRDLLASADAFVLPTRGEGWGLPIAEAMSMAMPVIVSDVPGPRAYANSSNAYMVPVLGKDKWSYYQPDPSALEAVMRTVIVESGPRGGGKAREKSKRGRERMKEFSPEYVVGLMASRLRQEGSRRMWDF